MSPEIKVVVAEPREGLFQSVLARIEEEKRRQAKIRLIFTSVISMLSVAAIIPATEFFVGEFWQSGLYQYATLALTDGGQALILWKELSLSVLESLPVLSITAVLVPVFVILTALKFILKDTKILFNKMQLA